MKIGVYPRYGRLGASSRLRTISASAVLPGARLHPLWSDGVLRQLYLDDHRSFGGAAWGMLRRLCRALALEKRLLIEYELFPGLPGWWEKLFLRGKSYILDFDDAVWAKYRSPRLRGKFDQLMSGAAGIVCANHFLADYARQFNPRVALIPTPVECGKAPEKIDKYPEFTIAWIGTPVTWRAHMESFLPGLEKLAEQLDFTLLVVSGKRPEVPEKIRLRYVAWREENELVELSRAHVGIMPLGEDEFSQGKSAYKLIQYAACGLPAVASPVGENRFVLRDGETGFWAQSMQEWQSALSRLAADSNLREKLGGAAKSCASSFDVSNFQRDYQKFCAAIWGI